MNKKKDQTVKFAAKEAVKIGNETLFVEPQLLFQRLVFYTKTLGTDVSLEEGFSHELCLYPAALFEKSNFLFATNNPQLSQAFE